jgi:NADH-quinone oxidoreductase subunit N
MEIQALSAYTLTAMLRKSEYSAEAGVKYFILGSIASVIYLFGVSYVYGASGTLYMHEISIKVGSQMEVLGFILILSAFLFKVGLFPFHQWVPDIYQGASTPSTTILSTLAKLGAVGVLLRLILGPFYISFQVLSLQDILSWIAANSMLIGAVLPITQTHLKRLLGYSTIGHAGFLIMGLWEVNSESVAAIIAYLLVYSLTLMMTFVCIMSLEDKGNISENCNDLGLMQLKGLSQIRPKHAFILSVCFLSMAGVPPLIGFFPKLLILKHVINKESIFLASAAILSTVVSLFYYLKLIKLMYMDIPTRQVIGTKVNKKIWIIFLPMLFIQILGCYVPILQGFYKQCIVHAVTSLFIGYNEKNYP